MRLSDWLKAHTKTSRDFAEMIGVSEIAVKRYRTGARIPNRDVMTRIVRATDGAVMANDFHEVGSSSEAPSNTAMQATA